jgi:dolichol-phosphate mannosyltransferase
VISVVIPIYNEEETLPQLFERLAGAAAGWGEEWETVLVDDGSSDRSLELMEELAADAPSFRILQLSRNFGHQAAISAGIQHARGDAVVVMDGDLQDPPEVVIELVEKWREGWDVVYAVRRQRKESLFKRASYNLFYRLLDRLSDFPIPLDAGDFCLMDRRVVDVMLEELPERVRFVRGLRAYVGFRQTGVEYERHGRAAGEPKYTFWGLVKLALSGLVGFSLVPLRIATFLGFAVAVPSLLLVVFLLLQRIFGFEVLGRDATEVPGYASLAGGLFFVLGVILTILGIIGEYLGMIYLEVKRRPGFIVARELGAGRAGERRAVGSAREERT